MTDDGRRTTVAPDPSQDAAGNTHVDMIDMKIKALVPWFGAKRILAPKIVELLGRHSNFWEPFCGSMAVLLSKRTCSMETVNDLHDDLINLALVIQDREQCLILYRRLRRVLVHETLMDRARAVIRETDFEPGVERAYWYFLQSWIGRNGTAGTKNYNQAFCRRFTARGGSPSVRLVSVVKSIPQWRKRLSRVCILKMDAFEMIEKIEDAPNAAIYVDPPYFKIGTKYVHNFQNGDHERLAELLNRFEKARIVLSYYDDPKLDELYPGWTQVKIEITKALGHACVRGRKYSKATEVLLVNGPVEAEQEEQKLF